MSAYPTKAVIKRVCKAAEELGIKVVGFRVGADGSISVWDAEAKPANELDEWRKSRSHRTAAK